MKKLISILILFILLAIFTNSCKTVQPYLNQNTKDSIITVYENKPFDTLYYLNTHTGKAIDFNNCDSLMALLLRNNNEVSTKENGIKQTIILYKNRIVFKCNTDSLNTVISLIKKSKQEVFFRKIIKEVPANCQLKHLTWWDKFFIVLGKILSLFIIACLISLSFKIYKQIKP